MAENSWGQDDFSSVNDGDDAVDRGDDDLSIDMETLFTILDEKREQPPIDLQVGFLKIRRIQFSNTELGISEIEYM